MLALVAFCTCRYVTYITSTRKRHQLQIHWIWTQTKIIAVLTSSHSIGELLERIIYQTDRQTDDRQHLLTTAKLCNNTRMKWLWKETGLKLHTTQSETNCQETNVPREIVLKILPFSCLYGRQCHLLVPTEEYPTQKIKNRLFAVVVAPQQLHIE